MRKTTTTQLGIVTLSLGLADLLATDPIPVVRFRALLRGKRRLARLRAFKRGLAEFFGRVGFVLLTLLGHVRAAVEGLGHAVGSRIGAGCGFVARKAQAGKAKVVRAKQAVGTRLTQVSDRLQHFGAILVMYAGLYGLLVRPMSRKVKVGWTRVETSVPAVEPMPVPVVAPIVEPEPVMVEEPHVALAHALPIPSAARLTHEDDTDDDRTKLAKEARKLMEEEGMSQRKAAAEVGLAESTLRSILKRMK